MSESDVRTERVQLKVSDGTTMSAYAAQPRGTIHAAGIIVLQEAFGVNRHIRNVTERLAREGYVSLAPELFHRTAPGYEGDYGNFQSVMPHIRAMTTEGAEADLRAAFDWLHSMPGASADAIHSVGFCMGGRVSFLANSILPLRGAVAYYGGPIAPDLLPRVPALHGPMLFFWGGADKHIPPELRRAVVDALSASGKSFINVEFSQADHGFNCDERPSYHPTAAHLAWTLMLQFLRT